MRADECANAGGDTMWTLGGRCRNECERGACCKATGCVDDLLRDECEADGGSFNGGKSECDRKTCGKLNVWFF